MSSAERSRLAGLCALLGVGLLFDTAGLLRMGLCCAFLHEAGHVLAFLFCKRRLPRFSLRAGGFAMRGVESLSAAQEFWVLCAGPAANFFAALAALWCAQKQASYSLYFFIAVNLCIGFYNLLPFGTLDGARLIACALPPAAVPAWEKLRGVLTLFFCAVCVLLALANAKSLSARAALLLAGGYLAAQGLFCRRDL